MSKNVYSNKVLIQLNYQKLDFFKGKAGQLSLISVSCAFVEIALQSDMRWLIKIKAAGENFPLYSYLIALGTGEHNGHFIVV